MGGPLCEPILDHPEGMGGHRKTLFRGVVWIFSGTAHCNHQLKINIIAKCSYRWLLVKCVTA